MVNVFGTFERVHTQEDCEFYALYFGDEAKKWAGGKERFTTTDMGPGKIAGHWTMTEPEPFSFFAVFYEGIENEIEYPHFGGLNKVNFQTTEDGYKTTMESKKFGVTHVLEKYSDEGVHLTWTYKGKSNTEFWTRIVDEDGFYRIHSNENIEKFMKEDGMPDDFVARLIDEMTIQWKATDDGFEMTECFGGGLKVKSVAKFDEEIDYQFPGEGVPSMKFLTTKLGGGKYKAFVKANGSITEWNYHFTGDFIHMTAKNTKSGMTCKVSYKKYTPIAGKWTTIAIENAQELFVAAGCPPDVASKYSNDFGVLEWDDRGPVQRWNWISDIAPMDVIFKFDEETDFFDPVMQDKAKCLVTLSGNKFMMVTKYSKVSYSWITNGIVTDNFLIMKTSAEGLKAGPAVYIAKRN